MKNENPNRRKRRGINYKCWDFQCLLETADKYGGRPKGRGIKPSKQMKKCSECKGSMVELKGKTPEGVEYRYFRCKNCKEEILDMKQLHKVAEKYREMKMYNAKLTMWGQSLGLRIPKELAEKYRFKDNEKVTIIPEEKGIKVIPA